jgi:serine/threonine-protein kinase
MPDGRFPQQIGRYEIVGHLASGGMAEVLLGRLRGPHGFERAAVVKRILPHLAMDPAIVEMFLDEARIIANLRHPNLIHVHELGQEQQELFIAMEYLEGESVAGLCRRLASRGLHLDLSLAAHIVSEACAGLHAAHEATSPDGRPLQIVHRDVSPQNIFIEYSGAVRVIDFGIATNVDRVSRTEAGTVRGKFEYLAPEQLWARPLDRRVDVFALGVVLFELASGRRLFKRESQAATMTAVLEQPAPSLAQFRPDASARLDAICARALSKDRGERYASAAEMRAELRAFLREQTDKDLPDELGRLMRQLFEDRIAEKREMLRRVEQGSDVVALPSADVDLSVDLPTACEVGLSGVSVTPRPRGSRRWLLPAAALLGLLAIAGGAGIVAGQRRSSRATTTPAAAGATESAAAVTATVPVATPALDPPPAVELPQAADTAPAASVPVRRPSAAPHPAARAPTAHALSSARPAPTIW